MILEKKESMGVAASPPGAREPNPQAVSALRASPPNASPILIDKAEYMRRREEELASAMRSVELFGSWTAYAASMLHMMVVFEKNPSHQWGSHHHQVAILSAGLADEAEAIEARRVEARTEAAA